MKIIDAYKSGYEKLAESGIADAKLDSSLLLQDALEVDKGYILAHGDNEADSLKLEKFFLMIDRRSKREPLQHIVGYTNFMGLKFLVNGNVLIPRPDTEILVEEVLKDIHDGMRVLDMCTGSGCILISILNYTNDCSGVGVDISEKALKTAEENAALNLAKAEGICFIHSNLYENVNEEFDIIVSNPPYIETKVIETLESEVKDYDPMLALDGGEDGLYFYRKIISGAKDILKPSGMIFFEIGYNQAEEVSNLLSDAGFGYIEVIKDYAGLDRVVKARRKICLTN